MVYPTKNILFFNIKTVWKIL